MSTRSRPSPPERPRRRPNPMVEKVVLLVAADGETILGEGWHRAYGGPHAEVWAVRETDAEATSN